MKPYNKFGEWFQIRWREPLGRPECPYLYRWTLILFGYTIRLHHWIRSDDRRFFHDHASNFVSFIIKGRYTNVVWSEEHPEGIRREVKAGQCWKSIATTRHYLDIPRGGAWTLLLCGRPYHKWGFYVPNKETRIIRRMRPLKYFHEYGTIQDENYQ